MMTKAAMSIFSCYFPEGDDTGASFMVAQPSEPCWQEDGLQFAMIAPACIVITVYSFGYPVALWLLYHKNRHIIMRDQVLRAAGKGHSIKTNKDIHFRKRYGILYSYFKPSHYWWVLMFIGRKFFACAFAVGLRNYPTFQLASMLLVMFCCLLIQVRQRPFLDTRERAELLIDLNQKKLAYANSLIQHMVLFAREHHQDLNRESPRMRKMRKRIADFEAVIKGYKTELLHHDGWWWNLNSLEETLSTGAVILMLTGITFDTTYVKNSPTVRGTIAMVMVALLLAEIVFYCMHFVHEVKNVKKVNRKLAKVEWKKLKAWRIHNFKENKLANKKKVLPAGLAAKIKIESEKTHMEDIMAGGKKALPLVPAVVPLTSNTNNTAAANTGAPCPCGSGKPFSGCHGAAAPPVAADDIFGNLNQGNDDKYGTVDDLFDLFEDADNLGFDVDDIFDDANVFSGTADKELDFMNKCMDAPTKKKTNKSTGKTEGFCLDDFLEQGLKFNPNEDLFGTDKPKEKKKDRDSARNERKAAREAKKKKNKANKSRGEGLSLDDLLDSDSAAPLHDEQLDNLFGSTEFGNKEESSKMENSTGSTGSTETVEEKSKDDLRKDRNEARKQKKEEAREKMKAAKANAAGQSGQSLDDLFGDAEEKATLEIPLAATKEETTTSTVTTPAEAATTKATAATAASGRGGKGGRGGRGRGRGKGRGKGRGGKSGKSGKVTPVKIDELNADLQTMKSDSGTTKDELNQQKAKITQKKDQKRSSERSAGVSLADVKDE